MLLYLEYEKTKNEGEQLRSEGGSSLSFFENQKSTFILEKKALVVSIFGLKILFKM